MFGRFILLSVVNPRFSDAPPTNTAFLRNKYPLWNIAPAVVASKCHHPRRKHTNISSTNQGHGLCYYFFIVEVKESRPASGIK